MYYLPIYCQSKNFLITKISWNLILKAASTGSSITPNKYFVFSPVDSGTTVLMDAVLGNHLEIVKFLISQNCDLNIQSRNENVTALDIAKYNGLQEIITHLEQIM